MMSDKTNTEPMDWLSFNMVSDEDLLDTPLPSDDENSSSSEFECQGNLERIDEIFSSVKRKRNNVQLGGFADLLSNVPAPPEPRRQRPRPVCLFVNFMGSFLQKIENVEDQHPVQARKRVCHSPRNEDILIQKVDDSTTKSPGKSTPKHIEFDFPIRLKHLEMLSPRSSIQRAKPSRKSQSCQLNFGEK
jgi:hypothetical protein